MDILEQLDKIVSDLSLKATQFACPKRQILKDLDLFVLDNSIRESTVGQLRGHTLENKWKIYDEVKRCGFKYIVVAAFSHMTRVDDTFIQELIAEGEDPKDLFAFTEAFDHKNDLKVVPVALRKMKLLGLQNPIIEIDTQKNKDLSIKDWHQLLTDRIEWTKKHLNSEAKIFINFRDFPDAMRKGADTVFRITAFLASLSEDMRPFGLMFEEPTGNFLPEEVGTWTRCRFSTYRLYIVCETCIFFLIMLFFYSNP